MGKMKDLTGMKFGKLFVVEYTGKNKWGNILWKCHCDCGNETIVRAGSLRRGLTKSCGCLQKEIVIKNNKTHKRYNDYIDMGNYYIGYTRKGENFKISKKSYDLVKDYCWYISKDGYVVTNVITKDGIKTCLKMHRLILGLENERDRNTDRVVDHKNRDKTNNRLENIWICTMKENCDNRGGKYESSCKD